MIRLLLTACAAFLIVVTTAATAASLLSQRQDQQTTLQVRERVDSINAERGDWKRFRPDSLVSKDLQKEALRTLDLLDQLYAQEAKLWSYYETVDQSLHTHSQYVEERMAYEKQLAEHEATMAKLQAQIDNLKPTTAKDGITFHP